jgi:hypothetical protein
MAGLRRIGSALLGVAVIAGLLTVSPPTPARAATGTTGGVTLGGYGGLHAFGGLDLNTSFAPSWPNWDIARAAVIRQDASGGWVLDGWGGIHAFGIAPGVATPAFWKGWDIARAIVVASKDANGILDGRQGYLLDGYGGLHVGRRADPDRVALLWTRHRSWSRNPL